MTPTAAPGLGRPLVDTITNWDREAIPMAEQRLELYLKQRGEEEKGSR